ncbi:MAG: putative metal-binding motif-containing protein [Alphaproteobacteria bacterium]|nr:putative metal-binding motif-containing protein [Alphaproteobacteria bacterium]
MFVASLYMLATGCHRACEQPWYADRDGDGWGADEEPVVSCDAPEATVARGGDCDDADAAVHPERSDGCNGIDDDCDGVVDPDLRRFFVDVDHDGWGSTRLTTEACEAPPGFVEDDQDCDDDDARAHPGADERCNRQDDDCDGQIDEDAPGDRAWYRDADGDGYGTVLEVVFLCIPDDGWVAIGGDCDDTDSDVSPAATEACNGIDDDCNGLTDAADPGVSDAAFSWPDADGDGHGTPTRSASLSCPGAPDRAFDALDCDDTDPAVHVGATEVCGGGDEDCDGLVDDLDPDVDLSGGVLEFLDRDGDGLGDPDSGEIRCARSHDHVDNDLDCDDIDRRVGGDWWVTDLDGDGVGAGLPVPGTACHGPPGTVNAALVDCDDDDPSINPTAPEVCGDGIDQDCTGFDPACREPFRPITDVGDLGRRIVADGDQVGVLAAAGDLDGDGHDDLAEVSGTRLTVFFGPLPEVFGDFPEHVDLELPAPGAALLALDVDQDGRSELVVGTPSVPSTLLVSGPRHAMTVEPDLSGSLPAAGRALANAGGPPGTVLVAYDEGVSRVVVGGTSRDLDQGCVNPAGVPISDSLGWGGNVYGLGAGDAIAGSPDAANGAGQLWVWRPRGCFPNTLLYDISLTRVTGGPAEGIGTAVGFGDVDGDGLDELIGAAVEWGGDRQGAVMAYNGSGQRISRIEGGWSDMSLGTSFAAVDVDDDGEEELLAGAPGASVGGAGSGAVYVFDQPLPLVADALDATWILVATDPDALGTSVVAVDLDGDGVDEPILGGFDGAWWLPSP